MAYKTLLTDTPTNLIKRYHAVLKNAQIPVEKMILFGSYAKKKQHKDSDLDICVVSKRFGKHPFDEMVELAQYANKVDSMIEPHPYNPKDLRDKWDPLAHEIRTHGIRII